MVGKGGWKGLYSGEKWVSKGMSRVGESQARWTVCVRDFFFLCRGLHLLTTVHIVGRP